MEFVFQNILHLHTLAFLSPPVGLQILFFVNVIDLTVEACYVFLLLISAALIELIQEAPLTTLLQAFILRDSDESREIFTRCRNMWHRGRI